MTTGHVVFTDPETGAVIDSYVYASIFDGETTLDARDMVSRMLGIDTDPAALVAKIEADPGFVRHVLGLVPDDPFLGECGGRLDAIAADRIAHVQHLCRVVEARHACQVALLGINPS